MAMTFLGVSWLCLTVIFFLYYFNLSTILNRRLNKGIMLLLAIICSFIDISVYLNFGLFIEKTSFLIIMILGIGSLFWRNQTQNSYLRVISTASILSIIHLSFTIISDLLTPYIVNSIPQSLEFQIIAIYAVQIILCCLFNLCLRSKTALKIRNHLFQSRTLTWSIFAITSMITGIFITYFYFYYDFILKYQTQSLKFMLVLLYILMIISFSIAIAIFSYIRLYREKWQTAETLLLQQKKYNQVLENLQQDIRHFQHDYKNVLASFYLLVEEGNLDQLQVLMKNNILSFERSLSDSMAQFTALNNIESIELKSLLLTKLLHFESEKLSFNLEITSKINSVAIPIRDLVRCLGIILDNAIEEVEKYTSSQIDFIAYQEQDVVTFIIANPVHSEIELDKIKTEGISSKGQNRGVGLTSLQKIIDHYPNVLNKITITNGKFQQVLKVPVVEI